MGNIFINNLDKNIDNESLFDIFSGCGNIISCNVATDREGYSKGYGYIQFGSERAASNAIRILNGIILNNRKILVKKFIPRS